MAAIHSSDNPAVTIENSILTKLRRVRPPVAPVRPVETISVTRYRETIQPTSPAGEIPKGNASKLKIPAVLAEKPAG
jgi:hypothetical protein